MSYVYATKPAHDAYVTSYGLNQVTETATYAEVTSDDVFLTC